jgi:putative ATP-binding cassette transporter
MTFLQRGFLDALLAQNLAELRSVLWRLGGLVAVFGLIASARPFMRTFWANRMRFRRFTGLGELYFGGFRFAIGQQSHRLPEVAQRLSDDVDSWSALSAELADGAVLALAKFVLFGAILWLAMPAVSVGAFTLRGPLLWFTIASFLLMLGLMHVTGKGLPARESGRLEKNAALRSALARVDEHALSIALLDGGPAEARGALAKLRSASGAALFSASVKARLAGLNALFTPADLLVFLLLAPLYFRGQLSFGAVFQVSMAYNGAGSALGWFVAYYGEIAQLRALRQRLRTLEQLLESLEAARLPKGGPLARATPLVTRQGAWLHIESLDIRQTPEPLEGGSPRRTRALVFGSLSIEPGERVLLTAPSGFGKSLLLATLRGAWPWASGSATVPREAVWIPQKPYMPYGTLRAALCYPRDEADSETEINWLLERLGLAGLVLRLGETAPWGAILSGGELARLALVRAILQKPRWIFMDEPTAALDAEAGQRYWRLVESLEGVTIVLIAHTLSPPYDRWRRIRLDDLAHVRSA